MKVKSDSRKRIGQLLHSRVRVYRKFVLSAILTSSNRDQQKEKAIETYRSETKKLIQSKLVLKS